MDPLPLCRIIETFMIGTIQEFTHRLLLPQRRSYSPRLLDAVCIGAKINKLDGDKRR